VFKSQFQYNLKQLTLRRKAKREEEIAEIARTVDKVRRGAPRSAAEKEAARCSADDDKEQGKARG
jgi:hypothetical protein